VRAELEACEVWTVQGKRKGAGMLVPLPNLGRNLFP
jgi:hypothetical protein